MAVKVSQSPYRFQQITITRNGVKQPYDLSDTSVPRYMLHNTKGHRRGEVRMGRWFSRVKQPDLPRSG